jgi:hypothetical protein
MTRRMGFQHGIRAARFGLSAALVGLASCTVPVASEIAAPPVDDAAVDTYARELHPLLEASCATLDCHGADRRPLQLFSETGRRLRGDLRGEPLTREEWLANVRALRTLDVGESDPDHQMLLLKPLAVSAGGAAHVGGDVWPDRAAPGYVCLRAFVVGDSDSDPARAACATAREAVKLPDPE